ncbi:MAG: glycoside-pentoside-hexuronide (GPH):cation symporter [Terrisporobacter sp.]|uniref:MFS transporter n=1 Tax=Terrisporobacter sp. TaxID=1965305 RepID=UPI002FCBC40A
MKDKSTLTIKDMLGYTVGSIGDSTAYNFVISFFSFFMITIAGISPIVAGSIISLAIVWDAITDPIIGFMIDYSKNKKGKRRPYILKSLIPMATSIILMFLKVDLPQAQLNLYYLVLVLIFWTSYTTFNIPYYSFGAVLTNVDNERVKISAYREVMSYIGVLCASSIPTFIVGKLLEKGINDSKAWFVVGIIVAVITTITILIMWKCTDGKEPIEENTEVEKISIKGFFNQLRDLIKLKPYLLVIICALLTNIYLTLFNSNLIYYAIYNMNTTEVKASVMFTVMTISSIALIPFITKAVDLFTKEKVFISCMMFSGVSMIIAKFVGIPNVFWGCIYVVIVGVGTCAYWMCIFNFLYDVMDFDEYKTGKKRDGIIMSYYSFLLKLGGAIAAWISGVLLQTGGFNANLEVQTSATLNIIESLFTIYPGICMLLAGAVMILTPLKYKKMNELRLALAKRRAGEEYNQDGFDDIV